MSDYAKCARNPVYQIMKTKTGGNFHWWIVLRATLGLAVMVLFFATKSNEKTLAKGYKLTTNNRMEMLAAVVVLQTQRTLPCYFTTDSQYVRQGITSGSNNREKRNWKTSANKPVKNADLWQALDHETARHQVDWHWVKGHAGHRENEMCDELKTSGSWKPNRRRCRLSARITVIFHRVWCGFTPTGESRRFKRQCGLIGLVDRQLYGQQ